MLLGLGMRLRDSKTWASQVPVEQRFKRVLKSTAAATKHSSVHNAVHKQNHSTYLRPNHTIPTQQPGRRGNRGPKASTEVKTSDRFERELGADVALIKELKEGLGTRDRSGRKTDSTWNKQPQESSRCESASEKAKTTRTPGRQTRQQGHKTIYRLKGDMAWAAGLINMRTLRTLNSTLSPPQSVVNIMIAYVSLLQRLKSYRHPHRLEFSAVLQASKKTYESCKEVLEHSEAVKELTADLVNFVEESTEEELDKMLKVKYKYLVGWDMRPTAFSDRYYAARTVLLFLVNLLDYVEVAPAIYL